MKRLSNIGDALSHASLAGVAIGLCLSVNPVLMAVVLAIIAAFIIEYIRRAFPSYSEIATALVLSLGVALAAIASGFVKNPASFNSFLFGSIVAINQTELYAVVLLSVVVIVTVFILYRELFYITFDEESAALSGVPVKTVNTIFTLLTAIVVSVSARTVGALVISSLMIIPVAAAMLVSKSYKQNVLISIVLAVLFTIVGLFASVLYDLKPGGAIVLTGILVLALLCFVRAMRRR